MRPPGPGRPAGRHRVATGGSRGRAAPPAQAPGREIPIEAAPPAPAPCRMARGRVNGAATAAGAGPRAAPWGGGARALLRLPRRLRRPPLPHPARGSASSPPRCRRTSPLPAADPRVPQTRGAGPCPRPPLRAGPAPRHLSRLAQKTQVPGSQTPCAPGTGTCARTCGSDLKSSTQSE
ncbi:uncharacterized protein LOC118153740 [Callithrix jacchus]|uniref:atherin-like n=1 Tax=Callithrix jacchus TaxID=9483 RepID=UPI00159E51F6|nr:atherin-like [Callithrix jacchus]